MKKIILWFILPSLLLGTVIGLYIAWFQAVAQLHYCKFVNIAFGTGSYE